MEVLVTTHPEITRLAKRQTRAKIARGIYEQLITVKQERNLKMALLRPLIFFLSLNISLVLIIVAINWKTYDTASIIDLGNVEMNVDDLIRVPPSHQPPPPPPKQNIIPPQIVEVPEEEILEEVDFELDVEISEETLVQDVIIDYADQIDEEVVDEIFQIVEVQPQPVGGMQSFYKYIGDNLRYPEMARRLDVSGMVFVKFVVEKNGEITDVQVIKGIGSGCDEEAVRVLSSAPAWHPGKQRGRPVRVYMTVPIRFVLTSR